MKTDFDINYAGNFSRNVITNIISILISSLTGLLLVPFFIDSLGPAAYALLPLATTLASYVTFFIDTLNYAISRYLTIDLQKGDLLIAKETYCTSFTLLILLVLGSIPLAIIVSYLAPIIFQTGNISNIEVILFFILLFGSILISTLKSNYMTILFSYNRLDLRNIITITQTIVQTLLIVILFILFGATLYFIGLSYMAAAILTLLLSRKLARRQNPELSYSLSYFNKKRVRELISLSSYLVLDRFGCYLLSQTALIVVNIYYGAIAQTEYSLVITWCTFLTTLASVVSSTVAPKVYSLVGSEDNEGLIRFTSSFTKILGLFIALPITLLCIFAPQLMTLWVGSEYASLTPLVWLLVPVSYFIITLSGHGSVAIARNKMQFPAISNTIAGIIYLVIAILISTEMDWGYYGIALAYGIVIFIHYGIIASIYYSYVAKAPLLTYTKNKTIGFIAMMLLMLGGGYYTLIVDVDSLIMLIISGAVISIIYLLVVVKIILSKDEKEMVKTCLPKYLRELKIIRWL